MNILDYVDVLIPPAYLIALLYVGVRAGRGTKSSEDFALADGQLPFSMLLGTLLATAVGAAATLGRAGKAYEVGILIALSGVAYGTGMLCFSWLAPKIKKANVWSVPAALSARYGGGLRLLSAIIILITITGLFGVQLIALGITTTLLFEGWGLTFEIGVIICALVMTGYTIFGGMKSVAAADILQALVIFAAIGLILPVLLVIELDGPVEAVKTIPPSDGNWLGGMTLLYLFSIFLIDIPVVLIDPSLWQKTGAAASVRAIQRASIFAAIVFVLWAVLICTLGVFAQTLLPGLSDTPGGSDAALPALILNFTPPLLKGLAIAALTSVMVSTAATALLVAGTTFGFEIVKPLRPQTSDVGILRVTRAAIAIVSIVGVLFAISLTGVFDLLLIAMAVFVSGLFVPTMAALFWSRATKLGAVSSTVGGVVTLFVLYALKSSNITIFGMEPIIGGLVVSGSFMYIASRLTFKESTATQKLVPS